jgi:hypothetical protein
MLVYDFDGHPLRHCGSEKCCGDFPVPPCECGGPYGCYLHG